MRINQFLHSKGFISFVNGTSFILSLICFILVILLPLPYHREPPGTISLCNDPEKAPLVIVICVIIPFQSGIIFQLIYKITYKKSKQELLNELTQNVAHGYITNETKYKWEFDVEKHQLDEQEQKALFEKKRKEKFIELKKQEEDIVKRIQHIEMEIENE